MCGFTGIINFKGLSKNRYDNKMSSALSRLYPRGPNQQGKWNDEKSYFVHSRLSIIDISEAGKQPMEKYGKVLLYNGEIYNFNSLRDNLIKLGYNFQSKSDAEVLLAGWDQWGESITHYLNGMYAFVIWDKNKEKLHLIRDPYGKKPLYYSLQPNGIAFSSDLKSLEKIIDCGEINTLALESLFSFRFIHDPLTIYKDVKKLPPGSILELNSKNYSIKKWYELSKNINPRINTSEFNSKLKSLFDASVNRRLVSDVPVGLFLSGGLDSSLILSSLAFQDKKIPCFTMGFKNSSSYYEERPEANRLAKYFGMEHHNLEIASENFIKIIPDVFTASDEPFADTSSLPFYALSKEVSKNVTVALSGDGGDEVFGGYRKYIGEKWANIGLLIPKNIRHIIANNLFENKSTYYGEVSRRLKRYLTNIEADPINRQINWLRELNDQDILDLLGFCKNSYIELFKNAREGFSDEINAILAGDMAVSLSGDMLVKLDRMSMANSLEVRSPFLDRELVEFAFSLPGSYKVGYLKGKKILRKAFSDRLPHWSINLPKKGFEVPVADWLKNDFKKLLDHITIDNNLEKIGITNYAIIDRWKKELFYNNRDTSWKLWTLISYYYWSEERNLI